MPTFYPVFLNLTERRCVIIGGGQIAEGKISKLLDSGAKIIVISPDATQGIRGFAERGQIELDLRKYQEGDLQGAFLAIAATNDRVVNQEIFEEAEKQGILLNAVDDMPRCSFIAPSIVERGPVTVAISTGGVYTEGPSKQFDFTEPYLRTVLGFLGMTDISTVRAEGVKLEGNRERAIEAALNSIPMAVDQSGSPGSRVGIA